MMHRLPYPSDLTDAEWRLPEPLLPSSGRRSTMPCASSAAKRRPPSRTRRAIIDRQSVKTTAKGGARGYDAGKKVQGRKRHIVVDTAGLLLAAVVHPADVPDRDGARLVLAELPESSATWLQIAMRRLMLRRLAQKPAF